MVTQRTLDMVVASVAGPDQIATNYHVIEDMLTGEPKLDGGVKLVGKEEIYALRISWTLIRKTIWQ